MEPNQSATKKLFHAVVVLGISTSAGLAACSDGTTLPAPPDDSGVQSGGDAGKGKDGSVMNPDGSSVDDSSSSADVVMGWAPCH